MRWYRVDVVQWLFDSIIPLSSLVDETEGNNILCKVCILLLVRVKSTFVLIG